MVRRVERKSIVFENVIRKTKPQLVFATKQSFEATRTEVRLKEVIKVDYEIIPERRLLSVRV